MPQESLRKNPLWRAEDLGKRVPDTRHAISVCLPRWRDVVGYEERDPATMEQLALGYPRFLYHPLVQQAFDRFGGENAQIYSTPRAAERCRAYLLRHEPSAAVDRRSFMAWGRTGLAAWPTRCLPRPAPSSLPQDPGRSGFETCLVESSAGTRTP